MNLGEALGQLESLGSAKMRAHNVKHGVCGDQYGLKMGDIRKVAKEIKTDHALALQLWDSGVFEARMLAILVMKPKQLSAEQLDAMVRSNGVAQVADWLSSYVIGAHPEKEKLRAAWMKCDHPMAARAGWSLTAGRIAKDAANLDLPGLLDRIEKTMPGAPPQTQWTMNIALAYIGIHHPQHRARALSIGEALGIYRDYPCSPGCTSPFAPIWINEMVRRQSAD